MRMPNDEAGVREYHQYMSLGPPDEPETFDATAFERLARAEPGHFWFEERRRLISWALGRYFPRARSFCEIGCGTGFVLEALARDHPALALTGIDPYPQALTFAGRRVPGAQLRRSGVLDDDGDETYDVVGCFDVLEHIPDDEQALVELTRRLRPGGGLMLTVPQHPRLWSAADEIGHHQRRYRRGDLLGKLRAANLACCRVTSFMTLLLPVVALRLVSSTREAALAELYPSPLANRVGHALLGTERRLIARGVSFPFGSSLLVVARLRGAEEARPAAS
jgi:2-polyprenyl-3-methyl-5-hydroxy-6-metoxy-1,4-benzoquinol methylase